MAVSLSGFTAVQIVVPPGRFRTVAGGALVLVAFATMAAWIRLNRVALEQQGSCDCARDRVTVRVIQSRRPAPDFAPLPPRPQPVAEQEDRALAVSGSR